MTWSNLEDELQALRSECFGANYKAFKRTLEQRQESTNDERMRELHDLGIRFSY